MTIKLKFLGAAETVTGSKFLLSDKHHHILIDCGLYQEVKTTSKLNKYIDFPASEIDYVILTHAHLDHSGYLPKLVKDGFKGKIYCTETTKKIVAVILKDSAKLIEQEIKKTNKHIKKLKNKIEPIYKIQDIPNVLNKIVTVKLQEPIKLKSFNVTFHEAGHIPGAASVGFEHRETSIIFSGDLGRNNQVLTKNPKVEKTYKNIVIESTYGDRLHPKTDFLEELEIVVKKAINKKSTLLIPSFSLGRSQMLLILFGLLFRKNPKLKIPLYVDSPMTNEITQILLKTKDVLSIDPEEFNDLIKDAHFITEMWQTEKLHKNQEAKIILSASGMINGGKVLSHLKSIAPDPNNILFVPGFQAENTFGRKIIEGEKKIELEDGIVDINAEVIHSSSFSAHADQDGLIAWLSNVMEKESKIFLVHGEKETISNFKEKLKNTFNSQEVVMPELNEEIFLA